MQLFVAKFPGNKFYNGILFGVAEVLSMVISNMLLLRVDDIVAFRIVFLVGTLSYGVLIASNFFASLPMILTYVAIVTLIGSIGA